MVLIGTDARLGLFESWRVIANNSQDTVRCVEPRMLPVARMKRGQDGNGIN